VIKFFIAGVKKFMASPNKKKITSKKVFKNFFLGALLLFMILMANAFFVCMCELYTHPPRESFFLPASHKDDVAVLCDAKNEREREK
jgi:RsiW-degrading membrane proteinase PrsW (M82 family)